MKKIVKIFALLMLLIITACTSSDGYLFGSPLFGNPESVEVRKGDTLYSLSKKYDIPLQTLASANKISPPYNLMAGQTIVLPKLSDNDGASVHIVKKGDTLYSISKKHNVPLRDLMELNDIKPPYALKIGQKLEIPNNRYHVVSKGDTLYNISKRYDVDVTSLSRVNNMKAPFTISIGDKLVLPASISSASYDNANKTPSSNKVTHKNVPTKTTKRTTKTVSSPNKKVSSTTKATTKTTTYARPVSTNRKTKFAWPVKGTVISQFGTIGKGRKNDGINIKAPLGTAVNAADKGVVVYAGNELKGFGNLILIKHPDGWITAYAHNERIFVRKGQSVRRSEKISAVGTTGGVNTPQLHFEIHVNKKPINPMPHLQ